MPEQDHDAPEPLQGVEQETTDSCRPLSGSVSRMLDDVADIFIVTEPKAVVPSLTRSSTCLTESPAMSAPPAKGWTATAPSRSVSDRDRTPVATPLVTGLVLSVNEL